MKNFRELLTKQSKKSGQALVEVAILLPLLLLLILGALDLGRLFTTKIVLTNAAREGAYFLTTHQLEYLNAKALIKAETLDQGITVADTDITFSGTCLPGNPCKVTVSKTTPLVFGPFLQKMGLLGGPVKVTRSVEMLVP